MRRGLPLLALGFAGCATASLPTENASRSNIPAASATDQRPTIGELSTARYCGLEAKVRMIPPDPSVSENVRNAFGIWKGAMERKLDLAGTECVTVIIEEVHNDGTMNRVFFRGGYAGWSDAPLVDNRVVTLVGNIYTVGEPGDQSTYVISGDSMTGTYTNPRWNSTFVMRLSRQ